MLVCPFFIFDAQAAELMQPSAGSLGDPAQGTQSGAVRQAPPRQPTLDGAFGQCLQVWPRVIGAVTHQPQRTGAWRTALAANLRDCIDQRQQLCDVVRVSAVAVRTARSHAVAPTRRLAASRANAASSLSRNSRIRPAAFPTECRF